MLLTADLRLSHKHMEENPWDTFETIFTIGSVHKCTVINKNDKGAILELPYGIEGFCAAKNLAKEDNSKIEVGESLDFKVLEFSKDDRRIVLITQVYVVSRRREASSSCEEEASSAKESRFNRSISKLKNLH